jgi:hypothetical protein
MVVELLFCLVNLVLGEMLSIEADDLPSLMRNLLAVGESLGVYNYSELLIEHIILQLKVCLHKFLLDPNDIAG